MREHEGVAGDGAVVGSAAQAAAWRSGEMPAPEEVAPDVWAIAVRIPEGTIPHTLAYALLEPGAVHLVDAGWDGEESLTTLERSLGGLGRSLAEVRTVISTHFHPDHLGLAERLRGRTGARTALSAVERRVLAQETSSERLNADAYRAQLVDWGAPADVHDELVAAFARPSHVPDADPDILLSDGDVLELGRHRLRVVATPGHTDGHVCLIDDDRRVLYSGDHVLPGIFSGIGIGTLPGSDPLGDYFASLDRLAPYDAYTVLPGHEFAFRGLGARRAAILAHHLRRTAEVAALVPELGDASVWDYARRLTWTAGWEGMRGFWLHSALRQTSLHREYVRSGRAAARLDA